jgi:DNA repair photolyase
MMNVDPVRTDEPHELEARPLVAIRGRGAAENPPNRFERIEVLPDPEALDPDAPGPRTVFLRDPAKTLIVKNDSPDVSFDYGINPYRGCEHGCSYCFARPTHEYLGFSAGLDFETRIMVKEDAPEILRRELSAPKWRGAALGMSGVTDPYQPVERRLQLTRRCVEVLAEFRNPVAVITKSHTVTRDADLYAELARHDAAMVFLSVTTLDASLQRVMEPRASTPARRLEAVSALAEAGVPVGVLIGPVIPGLNDHEIPAILAESARAGASFASYVALRLPHGLKELFASWLDLHFPDRKDKVLNRVRDIRGGELYDSRFHARGRGEGVYADHLASLFRITRRKVGLPESFPALSSAAFRHPPGAQLGLFG